MTEPTPSPPMTAADRTFVGLTLSLLVGGMFILGCLTGYTHSQAVTARRERQQLLRESAEYTPVPSRLITKDGPQTGMADETFQPPVVDQGSLLTAVYFASKREVAERCGDAGDQPAAACEDQRGARRTLLILPNPCEVREPYAMIVCHELGHAHGWPGDHSGGHFEDEANVYAFNLDKKGYLLMEEPPCGTREAALLDCYNWRLSR